MSRQNFQSTLWRRGDKGVGKQKDGKRKRERRRERERERERERKGVEKASNFSERRERILAAQRVPAECILRRVASKIDYARSSKRDRQTEREGRGRGSGRTLVSGDKQKTDDAEPSNGAEPSLWYANVRASLRCMYVCIIRGSSQMHRIIAAPSWPVSVYTYQTMVKRGGVGEGVGVRWRRQRTKRTVLGV